MFNVINFIWLVGDCTHAYAAMEARARYVQLSEVSARKGLCKPNAGPLYPNPKISKITISLGYLGVIGLGLWLGLGSDIVIGIAFFGIANFR